MNSRFHIQIRYPQTFIGAIFASKLGSEYKGLIDAGNRPNWNQSSLFDFPARNTKTDERITKRKGMDKYQIFSIERKERNT